VPDRKHAPSEGPGAALPTPSRLGLGAWAFGRSGWGHQDDQDSRAAILRAVELGVTWIDTAAVYGDGHSETLVGEALRQLAESERPLVFTKGGIRVNPADGTTYRDLSPASLRKECDASMRRLGVERIDLYQLHWPVADTAVVEQAWQTLAELRAAGKVRWIGASNFGVELVQRCFANHRGDALQVPLSLLSRESAEDVLPWAAGRNIHVLTYSPLESGLLSGNFSLQRLQTLPTTDWRRRRAEFQQPRLRRSLELVARLEPIADQLGVSVAELAIAWTSSWPGVAGVIVGARSRDQVDGWVGAAGLELGDTTLDAVAAALSETGAGAGPRRSHNGGGET
jgi:aryl-alcohol dehydrogenase-like predicted oxidoreductase